MEYFETLVVKYASSVFTNESKTSSNIFGVIVRISPFLVNKEGKESCVKSEGETKFLWRKGKWESLFSQGGRS